MAYILTAEAESVKMLLPVKSGNVSRGDIAKLRGDMEREDARLGTLITLENPTKPMRVEAQSDQPFKNPLTGDAVPKIAIVTVQEMVEGNVRLDSPVSLDALWKAKDSAKSAQLPLFVPASPKSLRKPAATAIDEPAAKKRAGQS